MKTIYGVILLSILIGCGRKPGPVGPAGQQGIQGERGEKGDAGSPGADAAINPYDVVAIKDPCGDSPGVIDEVLLVLANGQVLVSFSSNANGDNTRFAILPPGSYVTTDGSNCHFTLTADGEVL